MIELFFLFHVESFFLFHATIFRGFSFLFPLPFPYLFGWPAGWLVSARNEGNGFYFSMMMKCDPSLSFRFVARYEKTDGLNTKEGEGETGVGI